MGDHYYSRKQQVASDPIYLDVTLKNNSFRFKTDRGVFSKKDVDFGSRLLIDTFVLPEGANALLDVGCGYGPIGLSLARAYPSITVHMVDVNERALSLATDNALSNDVNNVHVYESDRLLSVSEHGFSVIITNPPIRAGKQVVHDILSQAKEHLTTGGELWVVIQKKQGAPSALKYMQTLYRDTEIIEKKKGYFVIKSTK